MSLAVKFHLLGKKSLKTTLHHSCLHSSKVLSKSFLCPDVVRCAWLLFPRRSVKSNLRVESGAIIRDGDRKRAAFLVLSLSHKLRHRVRHTRVHAARIFSDVAHGFFFFKQKMGRRSKFPNCLMLKTQYRLCLLEFCSRIFVVSCSNLNELVMHVPVKSKFQHHSGHTPSI